jgi:hypothetical protein
MKFTKKLKLVAIKVNLVEIRELYGKKDKTSLSEEKVNCRQKHVFLKRKL